MSMKYTIKEISAEEIQKILDFEENWALDKKGKDISPAKLSRTVAALANHNGGDIYLGISHKPNKNEYYWDGFSSVEDTNQYVDIISSIFPNFHDCSFEYYKNGQDATIVLHIIIAKTQSVIKASDGRVYLRTGAQNLPITDPEKLRQLDLDKGIASFEDEITKMTYDEIKNSKVLNDFIKRVVPSTNTYDWLKSQCLMNSETKISVAGVLLYADLPQVYLPKRSAIKILKYKTDEKEGFREALEVGYPITVEGDIYIL